jgi:hypothetical protein
MADAPPVFPNEGTDMEYPNPFPWAPDKPICEPSPHATQEASWLAQNYIPGQIVAPTAPVYPEPENVTHISTLPDGIPAGPDPAKMKASVLKAAGPHPDQAAPKHVAQPKTADPPKAPSPPNRR